MFGTPVTYGSVIMLVLYRRSWASRCGMTAWGRHVYATGDDAEAARLSGIRTSTGCCSACTSWPA